MQPLTKKLSKKILDSLLDNRHTAKRVLIYEACPQCGMKLNKRGVEVLYRLPMVRCIVARAPLSMLPVLASMGVISYIETDDDIKIDIDAAAKTVGAYAFREKYGSGQGVNIAVIDTGIFPHNDFTKPSNRIIGFVDFINDREEPYDDNGHGTFCAGCAMGSGYVSGGKYTGIAPGCGVLMLKAVDSQGSGSVSNILRAMQWVSDNAEEYNIKVLSISLGIEPKEDSGGRDVLSNAAKILWAQGITVVAAAGNSGPYEGTINSPGTCPDIITVGAINDRFGKRQMASFSSRGNVGDNKPDIVAPGVNITAASASGGYTVMSGTSMATPIAAGCAALLLAKEPGLSPIKVKEKLLENAVSIMEPRHVEGMGVVSLPE
ncbi:MAG: S8 family peptidase [Clostridia bacterium]|nr:S8 family peptidase [Clostridia bacterium]